MGIVICALLGLPALGLAVDGITKRQERLEAERRAEVQKAELEQAAARAHALKLYSVLSVAVANKEFSYQEGRSEYRLCFDYGKYQYCVDVPEKVFRDTRTGESIPVKYEGAGGSGTTFHWSPPQRAGNAAEKKLAMKKTALAGKETIPSRESQVDREVVTLWRQRCDRQTFAPPWNEEELRSILAKSLPEKEECVRQLEQERYIDDRLLQHWHSPSLVRRRYRCELDKLLAQPLEEKKRYLQRQGGKAAGIVFALACAGLFFCYRGTSSPAPPVPAPVWYSAGNIESLELHHSFLSTITTVVTTTGIYQVTGGVSAARGETVHLKQETLPFGNTRMSLCVHLSLQSTCYGLY